MQTNPKTEERMNNEVVLGLITAVWMGFLTWQHVQGSEPAPKERRTVKEQTSL